MPTAPIPIAIQFVQTTSYVPSQTLTRNQFMLDTTNPYYVRNAVLTPNELYVQYYTASGVIPLSQIYQAFISVLPSITWAPIITQQPTNSMVTHPTATYFSVVASAESALSYQWYSSSYSQSLVGSSSKLTNTGVFTGSTSASLTMSATNVSMNNSQFYTIVSNSSGGTTSSVALLNVL